MRRRGTISTVEARGLLRAYIHAPRGSHEWRLANKLLCAFIDQHEDRAGAVRWLLDEYAAVINFTNVQS